MEFFELIKTRRSARKFGPQAVDRSLVEKIIEAGTLAPSACNIQGWRFVVIDQAELKNKIVDAGGSVVIKNAPVFIIVFYDRQTANTEYGDYVQSAAACLENMVLAATDLGLGACWIAHLPRKRDLKKIVGAPDGFDPIAGLILGHREEQAPISMPRKQTLADIIGYNAFNPAGNTPGETNVFLKRLARKLYYHLPTTLKKLVNNFIDKHFVKKFNN